MKMLSLLAEECLKNVPAQAQFLLSPEGVSLRALEAGLAS